MSKMRRYKMKNVLIWSWLVVLGIAMLYSLFLYIGDFMTWKYYRLEGTFAILLMIVGSIGAWWGNYKILKLAWDLS